MVYWETEKHKDKRNGQNEALVNTSLFEIGKKLSNFDLCSLFCQLFVMDQKAKKDLQQPSYTPKVNN